MTRLDWALRPEACIALWLACLRLVLNDSNGSTIYTKKPTALQSAFDSGS